MAKLFQDDKGNTSTGRVAFIFSTIFFHFAFALIIFLLKEKLSENVVNLGALYSMCMATILTFKVQAKKGETKNDTTTKTTTD